MNWLCCCERERKCQSADWVFQFKDLPMTAKISTVSWRPCTERVDIQYVMHSSGRLSYESHVDLERAMLQANRSDKSVQLTPPGGARVLRVLAAAATLVVRRHRSALLTSV
ncbi:hypothetical protein EVAR_90966_1 [Eumeta japonica]|uniref:Uncharacterized protein n=1 Tax=Eumeta variegata TaxID=151549 RepID=A0A4C1Z4T4_EUMVA|nr:hypothetical protein EVAR_90966_1 [Eumeta japonica]